MTDLSEEAHSPDIKVVERTESGLCQVDMGALCFAAGASVDDADDDGLLSSLGS